jgi:hypothetical protein
MAVWIIEQCISLSPSCRAQDHFSRIPKPRSPLFAEQYKATAGHLPSHRYVIISTFASSPRPPVAVHKWPQRGRDPQIHVGMNISNGRGAVRGLAT